MLIRPVVDALITELIAREIDVMFIDPFVSSHRVDESHNGAIDAVAKQWVRVASAANCSIVLSHHTRKLGREKATAEMSRGAVSLIHAARTALVLNRMDEAEAKRFHIGDDGERRRHFTVQDDKHNRTPATSADWFRLASVDLGNGSGSTDAGDSVGVVEPWTPPTEPGLVESLGHDDLYLVQKEISGGAWRKDAQADDWAGIAVAHALDPADEPDTRRASRSCSRCGSITGRSGSRRGGTRSIAAMSISSSSAIGPRHEPRDLATRRYTFKAAPHLQRYTFAQGVAPRWAMVKRRPAHAPARRVFPVRRDRG